MKILSVILLVFVLSFFAVGCQDQASVDAPQTTTELQNKIRLLEQKVSLLTDRVEALENDWNEQKQHQVFDSFGR